MHLPVSSIKNHALRRMVIVITFPPMMLLGVALSAVVGVQWLANAWLHLATSAADAWHLESE